MSEIIIGTLYLHTKSGKYYTIEFWVGTRSVALKEVGSNQGMVVRLKHVEERFTKVVGSTR